MDALLLLLNEEYALLLVNEYSLVELLLLVVKASELSSRDVRPLARESTEKYDDVDLPLYVAELLCELLYLEEFTEDW